MLDAGYNYLPGQTIPAMENATARFGHAVLWGDDANISANIHDFYHRLSVRSTQGEEMITNFMDCIKETDMNTDMYTDMYTDMNSNIVADIRADLNTGKRHRPSFIRSALLILSTAAVLILPGCGGKKAPSVGIAEQYGIAYAPLQIMKEQKLLEKRLPGVEINWKQFGGPTGIREGMMNGEIDFGFMGVSPVLIGIDNGMKWRYATGISSNEVAIVTRNDIHSLTELTPKDRISILSPACTQHVLLCMLAGQQLGDPHALDNQLVSMSHPDSVNALLSATEITHTFPHRPISPRSPMAVCT